MAWSTLQAVPLVCTDCTFIKQGRASNAFLFHSNLREASPKPCLAEVVHCVGCQDERPAQWRRHGDHLVRVVGQRRRREDLGVLPQGCVDAENGGLATEAAHSGAAAPRRVGLVQN